MNNKLKYYLRGLGTGILVTAIILMTHFNGKQTTMSNEEIIARAKELGMMDIDSLLDLPQPTETITATETATSDSAVTEETKPQQTSEEKPTEALPTESSDSTNNTSVANPTETTEHTSATNSTETTTSTSAANPTETTPSTSATNPTETTPSTSATKPTETVPSTSPANPSGTGAEPGSLPTASTDDSSLASGDTVTITIRRGNGSLTVCRALAAAGLVEDADAYDRYLCSEGYDNSLVVGVFRIPVGATQEQIAKIITGKAP
jgi:hypothetical protein